MLDALKSPIRIRNLKVHNRVVMPPMATRFASEKGAATKYSDTQNVQVVNAAIDWIC